MFSSALPSLFHLFGSDTSSNILRREKVEIDLYPSGLSELNFKNVKIIHIICFMEFHSVEDSYVSKTFVVGK